MSVDGKNVSLWALKIGDGIFFKAHFKLRDIAVALNGTDRQFDVNWDESKKAVLLTTGMSYAPMGGEFKKDPANDMGTALAATKPTTVFILTRDRFRCALYRKRCSLCAASRIKGADIKLDMPVYKVRSLYGLSAPTTSYLAIENGIPYIILDTPVGAKNMTWMATACWKQCWQNDLVGLTGNGI